MQPQRPTLAELAAIYFKIGATAFGGPAAQLAMFEDELITRRRWVTHQRFLDFVGLSSLIPGPSATQVGLYIAREMRGLPGLLIGGAAFIGPAAVITAVLTWGLMTWGSLPLVEGPFLGIKAAILAVIFAAAARLARTALRGPFAIGLCLTVLAAVALGVGEIPALLLAGAAGGVRAWVLGRRSPSPPPPSPTAAALLAAGASPETVPVHAAVGAGVAAASVGAWPIFWYFFKIGALLWGGGYVLIGFLQGGVVEELGWLTHPQLMDAVSLGQLTPGPLYTVATAVGMMAGGWTGAAAATIGIFLPGLGFVALSGPWVEPLRRSEVAAGALDGVNAAAVAIMAAVLAPLSQASLHGPAPIALAILGGVGLTVFNLSPSAIVGAAAVLGGALHLLGWM